MKADEPLPEAVQSLPTVRQIIAGTIAVVGFVEIFCGLAGLTLGCMFAEVPCICPWDIRYGSDFDVLAHGHVFMELIARKIIRAMHFGTPCQSMTWARLPQLRSWIFPRGLPTLLPHQQELVELGNNLLDFTVRLCLALYEAASYFSIENPELSWLWIQWGVRRLTRLPGVIFTRFLFKKFLALAGI